MPRTIPVTRPSAASLGVGRGRALLGQPAPRRGESVSGPGQGAGAAIRGVLGGAWTASSGRLSRGVTAVTGRTPCPFLCVWPHTPTPPPAARRGEWRPVPEHRPGRASAWNPARPAPRGPVSRATSSAALSRPHSPGQATPKAVGPRGSSRGSRGALRRAPYGERLSAGGTGHPQTSGLLPPGAEAALGWAGGPGRLLGTAPPGGRCGARGLCFPCMPQCLARPAGFCD